MFIECKNYNYSQIHQLYRNWVIINRTMSYKKAWSATWNFAKRHVLHNSFKKNFFLNNVIVFKFFAWVIFKQLKIRNFNGWQKLNYQNSTFVQNTQFRTIIRQNHILALLKLKRQRTSCTTQKKKDFSFFLPQFLPIKIDIWV